MIQNAHESIHGAVGATCFLLTHGKHLENVLFSIVLYHNPPGSRNMVNSYKNVFSLDYISVETKSGIKRKKIQGNTIYSGSILKTCGIQVQIFFISGE